jgi:acyl-coenzyme A synthetase/AMP-(fatty) acid ligase
MAVEYGKLHLEIPEKFNLASGLIDRHIKEGRKSRLAILYGNQRLTYGEVNDMANRIGNAVRSLDVRREERVLLLLPDCPEFIASFLGLAKTGVVPVPTNTMLTPSDYQYMLNDSRAPS